jgi:hypothetical protein
MSKALWHLPPILCGCSYEYQFIFYEDEEKTTPMDLSGYSAEMQIREQPTSNVVLLEASTANGRITIDGESGSVSIFVDAEATAALDWEDEGVYDLLLTKDAHVWCPFGGKVPIDATVTR